MSKSNEDECLEDKLFIVQFHELLDDGQSEEVAKLFAEAESQGLVEKNLYEIVPMLLSCLSKKNMIRNISQFKTCEKLLQEVVLKCDPQDTLMMILDRAMYMKDAITFGCLMRPMRDCLVRSRPGKYIRRCVQTIKNYIKTLPQPENKKPQPEENEIAEEADPVVGRLIRDYKLILLFLEPVVAASALAEPQETRTRNYALSLHLLLFGYPFCYLQTNNTKQTSEPIFENSLEQMSRHTGNFLKFHGIIEDRLSKRKRESSAECEPEDYEKILELEIFRDEDYVSDLAYANYYYYLLNSEEGKKNLPQIYNPHYLMRGCFYLSTCMLKQPEYVLVSKGLKIAEATLDWIEKFSISHEVLEFSIYDDLFASLAQVMIYCDAEEERKTALKVFQSYIERFTMQARYLVLSSLYETANHSGFLALLTSITKSSIIHCLDQDPKCEHFLDKKLERLMKKICRLPNGSTSDLVEISDEVIAALNLVRFLTIRDKDNSTGIWRMIDNLEKNYLKPLREGIDMARAHWKVKVKDLEEQKKKIDSSAKASGREEKEILEKQITISVGGQNLPMMPASEKIKFCRQAINALDIMESIIIRINECIEENPQRFRVRSLWTSRPLLESQGQPKNAYENASSKESDEEYEKNIKTKILSASLNFVNEFGWSQQAISAGAESVGYPGIIHGMFPRGGAELAQHFYATCNAKLNEMLKAEALAIQANPEASKKSSEAQVRDALEKRLRMIVPYISTWPQAIALMTLPPNVPTSLANLLTLVDDICYYSGDRSVDFNWYTRRIVLAGIYKTTELYLLQDSSEDNKKTWEFMERRIEDAVQIHRVISVPSDFPPPDQALSRATEAASAAFITARNILGLNWNR